MNLLPAIDVFIYVSSLLSIDDLSKFCMVVWAIWDNRNKHNIEGNSKPSELVVSGALAILTEFQKSKRVVSSLISSVPIRNGLVWLSPPPGN